MTSQGARIHFFPSQLYAVVISYTCTCSASPNCQPPLFLSPTTARARSLSSFLISLRASYICHHRAHIETRWHSSRPKAISAAFQVIATSFSPHDGENTMRFERALQSLANQDLPRSYGVGVIVCMYSPLGREAAAHSLTFRELYVCNGD